MINLSRLLLISITATHVSVDVEVSSPEAHHHNKQHHNEQHHGMMPMESEHEVNEAESESEVDDATNEVVGSGATATPPKHTTAPSKKPTKPNTPKKPVKPSTKKVICEIKKVKGLCMATKEECKDGEFVEDSNQCHGGNAKCCVPKGTEQKKDPPAKHEPHRATNPNPKSYGKCTWETETGNCIDFHDCTTNVYTSGLCAGGSDIQCCVAKKPAGPKIDHGDGTHYGVDISAYQDVTSHANIVKDLTNMGKGATPFCFVKISEGDTYTWSGASTHIENFQKEGCLTGAYHFFHAYAGVSAQFDIIMRNLHGAKYLMLDIELPETNVPAVAKALIAELKGKGIHPIVYTAGWLAQEWGAESWGVPIWIAAYGSRPSVPAQIWQYTSSGVISGVSTVDVDKSLCSEAEFETIFA